MAKSIEKYLPEKSDTRPVQANIDTGLFSSMESYRKTKNLTWSELVTALFRRLADENKRKS